MRISSQLKKIPHYIRENGFANFLVYLITTTLLTSVNWLLVPFKKKTDTDPFYRVFNRFITSVNEMPQATLLEIGSRNVTGVVWRNVFRPSVAIGGRDTRSHPLPVP